LKIAAIIILVASLIFSSPLSPAMVLEGEEKNIYLSQPTIGPVKELGLPEAISIALKNNPDISSMVNAVSKSVYTHAAAAKEWLPTLSTDYMFMGFLQKPEMELGAGESFPLADETSLWWGSHVKMPIYTGNAIQYKKTIAKLGINVSQLRLLEAKADLIQEVTINYFNILRIQNYLSVAAENFERFLKHEDVTRNYFNSGVVAKNTLLEVQTKRANSQQEVIVTEENLKLAKIALNMSMGINIDTEYQLEDIPECRESAYSVEECYELATEQNPSLVAFTYMKERAKKVVALEKTELWPKLFGDFSFYKHGRTPKLAGDDYISNDIWVGMVVAKWKVFDWFKTRDRAKARKKELAILIDKRRSLGDRISVDIKRAHLNMQTAKKKFKAAQQEIEYAEENYRISELRYEHQLAPSIEVNNSLVLLSRARFHYYTAFYQYNVALARLERVIGITIRPE